jgi:hypothetical protein
MMRPAAAWLAILCTLFPVIGAFASNQYGLNGNLGRISQVGAEASKAKERSTRGVQEGSVASTKLCVTMDKSIASLSGDEVGVSLG